MWSVAKTFPVVGTYLTIQYNSYCKKWPLESRLIDLEFNGKFLTILLKYKAIECQNLQ